MASPCLTTLESVGLLEVRAWATITSAASAVVWMVLEAIDGGEARRGFLACGRGAVVTLLVEMLALLAASPVEGDDVAVVVMMKNN